MGHTLFAWLKLALVAVLLLPVVGSAQAQTGGTIHYSSSVFGAVSADVPSVSYDFDGTQGDLVTVTVIALTGNLDPAVSLLSPDGQPVASNDDDPLITASRDAHLSLFLASSGRYTLLVSGADGTTGDFLLRLRGRPPMPAVPLEPGVPVAADITPNAPPLYFTFEAAEECPTTLTVTGEPPGLIGLVRVRDGQGSEIALLRGNELLEERLTVAPQSGRYEVEVLIGDLPLAGAISLRLTCAEEAPPGLPSPTAIPSPTPPPEGEQPAGPPPTPDCTGFRLTAPTAGMANGPQTFTWDPAPGATGYRLSLYGGDGTLVLSQDVAAAETTVTLDVSTGAAGEGFLFVIEVAALYDGVVGCVSQMQVLRAAPPG